MPCSAPCPPPPPPRACRDLWPDPRQESCYAAYNRTAALPNFVERNGKWHHLAVVWTAANNGLTQVGAARGRQGRRASLCPGTGLSAEPVT